MLNRILAGVGLIVVAVLGWIFLSGKHAEVKLAKPVAAIGKSTTITVQADDPAGLKAFSATVEQNGQKQIVYEDHTHTRQKTMMYTFSAGKQQAPFLTEGPAKLIVTAKTNDMRGATTTLEQDVQVILKPPTIVADGKQIWFYDKDLAQANVRDMDTSLASTPASLLSGTGSVSAQFDITALPQGEGLQWFQLVPKHADTDFQLVRIGFDKGELRSMFLADKLNQITQLSFSNSKRNAAMAPDLFSFVPPPGVDVIGRGGK